MTALAVSLWMYLFGPPACERAAEVTPEPPPTPTAITPVMKVPETWRPKEVIPVPKKKQR